MIQQELLVFELGGEEFAVKLELVEEVVPANKITPIPNSPDFLLGLSAVRGKIMGVIDAGRRYGIAPTLNSHFMVCKVRGNLTAITIDRPLLAGNLPLRKMSSVEIEVLLKRVGFNKKFIKGAYELLEIEEKQKEPKATGRFFLEIDADLFVSAEMASRVGEA